jgi:hypothetical protein
MLIRLDYWMITLWLSCEYDFIIEWLRYDYQCEYGLIIEGLLYYYQYGYVLII